MKAVSDPKTNSAQRATAGVMFAIAIPVLLGFVEAQGLPGDCT